MSRYDLLSRLRDQVHELQVLVDEAIAAESRAEEEQSLRLNDADRSVLRSMRVPQHLRSVADLRDDYDQARAEDRGDIA